MTETLFHAYLPLIVWTSLGLILFRLVPETLPRWLGRGLYWVGIPLEILALARQTNFSEPAGLAPGITLAAIGIGIAIAYLCLFGLQQLAKRSVNVNIPGFLSQPWQKPSYQGSFILAAALGNTGFVGLSIAPTFIQPEYLSWIVFFSITHNIIGAYGFGVLIASYFGRSEQSHHWWIHLRDVLTVPILWAFAIGYFTQDVALPTVIESGLQGSIDVVIACDATFSVARMEEFSTRDNSICIASISYPRISWGGNNVCLRLIGRSPFGNGVDVWRSNCFCRIDFRGRVRTRPDDDRQQYYSFYYSLSPRLTRVVIRVWRLEKMAIF